MVMTKRKLAAVAVLGACLSINATCSGNRTPDVVVNNVAGYGQRAATILSDAQDLVVKATPSVIQPDVTAKIQVEMRNAAAVGLKLTDALELFDALSPTDVTARTAQISTITNLMAEVRKYTRVALVFVGQNRVGDELLKMYDNLETVFVEIQLGIDKWQASVAEE
jgi:hypothetical protein